MDKKRHGINRIRLEFKARIHIHNIISVAGINRIRLEFKDKTLNTAPSVFSGINRIRLEFKLFLESDALCSCFSWRVAHHWSGGYDWSCTGL